MLCAGMAGYMWWCSMRQKRARELETRRACGQTKRKISRASQSHDVHHFQGRHGVQLATLRGLSLQKRSKYISASSLLYSSCSCALLSLLTLHRKASV